MRRAAAVAALAALLAVPAAVSAKRVRVFAVGPRVSVSWLDTRAQATYVETITPPSGAAARS